jgi:hypothetical protein
MPGDGINLDANKIIWISRKHEIWAATGIRGMR